MKIAFRCDPALFDSLPRPQPAREALPEWLRAMAPRVESPMHGRAIRTVKQCPPFVDAMAHGFVLGLPCDVHVDQGRFDWDWSRPPLTLEAHPAAPLSFHAAEQLRGSPLSDGGQSALKFNSFWTIELEPGWSLMAGHPANRADLPFRSLSGLVDADRFHAVGINFPAVWTEPGFRGVLTRGTPVVQCHPVRREPLDLVCEPMGADDLARFDALAARIREGPGVYRRNYRRKGEAD